MPSDGNGERAATQNPAHPRDSRDGQKSYSVHLDDIASGIETTDSFAIKFSLLTKTPISKMKHLVRRLPATIWSGEGRSRAEHILSLIEEAGGKGSIVETGGAPSPAPGTPARPAKPGRSKPACSWCGFPMKEEETRCGFCMTPVGGPERSEHPQDRTTKARVVSGKRLIFYGVVLLVGIVIVELCTG
ncbi:MAG: hypothetical protein NTW97_03010 [Candidatus Krumholzibacteria bacterium]|nr:hypothetical protein [Candidatus Krumholzibacteria bacterium]